MAACTELEIVEKSSEENSCNIDGLRDANFYVASSDTAACNANREYVPATQTKVESETGDLKELSDDEFLHLLKEASTFNKPNNQESILLKQLRKEVADNDSCNNVITEATSASKRANQNCSNVKYNRSRNSTESTITFNSIPLSLPTRTFKIITENGKDKTDIHMILNSGNEYSKVIPPQKSFELQSNNNQWTLKPQSVTHHNNAKYVEQSTHQKQPNISNTPHSSYVLNLNKSMQNGLMNSSSESRGHSDSRLFVNSCDNAVDGTSSVPAEKASLNSVEQATGKPQDIELREIKKSKVFEVKEQNGDLDNMPDDIDFCEQLANSRFYVNCGDVDTPVAFPVKLISPMEKRPPGGFICDPANNQLKRQMNIPCIWPRNQVHSFIGSIPVDQDVLQPQNDADASGNPFSRSGTNITSFVSATLLDYPNSTLISENQASKLELGHRKHKRTRNHTENSRFILSENIAGHRGNEDIDSLVKFIEAADQNEKQLANSKGGPDSLKKKMNSRDARGNQNRNGSKKKLMLSNDDNNDIDLPVSAGKTQDFINDMRFLDINSNYMEKVLSYKESLEASEIASLESVTDSESPDVCSLSSEVCCSAEVALPTIEDSGFCVVKKKQRKKHQSKRSESYRWHSAAARARQSAAEDRDYYSNDKTQHDNSIMLLSSIPLAQRSPCGKQDSRRKSTSSVPHSEQSSADNSDLDSVHSLPVRGSAPHITKPHPHTTPSSSSSTPQASYADIARMPVSSSSSRQSPCPSTNSIPPTLPSAKQLATEDRRDYIPLDMYKDRDAKAYYTSPPAKSVDTRSKKACAIATSLAESKVTREINTQTELENASSSSEPKSDCNSDPELTDSSYVSAQESMPNESMRVCAMCSLNSDKLCSSCRGQDRNVLLPAKSNVSIPMCEDIPAVVMLGNMPTAEFSDISFGIDLNEIMQISGDNNGPPPINASCLPPPPPAASSTATYPAEQPCCIKPVAEKECYSPMQATPRQTKSSSYESSSGSNMTKKNTGARNFSTVSRNESSLCSELRLSTGRRLLFSDKDVNVKKFNYKQVVDHFAREWRNTQKEFSSDSNKTEMRVKYFKNCSNC